MENYFIWNLNISAGTFFLESKVLFQKITPVFVYASD
jgi:hypothetical protein